MDSMKSSGRERVAMSRENGASYARCGGGRDEKSEFADDDSDLVRSRAGYVGWKWGASAEWRASGGSADGDPSGDVD